MIFETGYSPEKNTTPQSPPPSIASVAPPPPAAHETTSGSKASDYARRISQLGSARDPKSTNAVAVYQMRLGNVNEAVAILRRLVLQPGCTWERADAPAFFKRNFATALLLAGLPAGCLSVLRAMEDQCHPRTVQLYSAIKSWERTLGFVRRWDWRLNGTAPRQCRITIDFEPGELTEHEVPLERDNERDGFGTEGRPGTNPE